MTGTSGTPSRSTSSEPRSGPNEKTVIERNRTVANVAAIVLMGACPQNTWATILGIVVFHPTRINCQKYQQWLGSRFQDIFHRITGGWIVGCLERT